MATEVESWVDRVLDAYERWQTCVPRGRWKDYYAPQPALHRPESIKAFNPSDVQDAIIWMHDGGMENAHIAIVLGIGDSRVIRDALADIEAEYEDAEG